MIILGIDPGSRRTGYGLIVCQRTQIQYLASGCITTLQPAARQGSLGVLFEGLQTIIQQYQPAEAAIEQIFCYRNPRSALILGQARGVALLALEQAALPISDYASRQVKQMVVGYGAATKSQIQQMVQRLLKLPAAPQADAADALAIAWCHAQCRRSVARIGLQHLQLSQSSRSVKSVWQKQLRAGRLR